MQTRKNEPFFTHDRSFFSVFLPLTLTVALQNLITHGVNLADNIMLGGYSEAALSGASLANQIQFLLLMLTGGIAEGVVVIGAQYWGRRDTASIKRHPAAGAVAQLRGGAYFLSRGLAGPARLSLTFHLGRRGVGGGDTLCAHRVFHLSAVQRDQSAGGCSEVRGNGAHRPGALGLDSLHQRLPQLLPHLRAVRAAAFGQRRRGRGHAGLPRRGTDHPFGLPAAQGPKTALPPAGAVDAGLFLFARSHPRRRPHLYLQRHLGAGHGGADGRSWATSAPAPSPPTASPPLSFRSSASSATARRRPRA